MAWRDSTRRTVSGVTECENNMKIHGISRITEIFAGDQHSITFTASPPRDVSL